MVCLLGRTPNNPPDVVSRGTRNIIEAMDDRPVSRLLVLTSMGLGSSSETVPWYVRISNATVLHDLRTDKARQEELVMQSDLDWTIVRPGGLTDAPRTGEYVHGVDIDASARPISRADVAHFLLQILQEDLYVRETPIVTSQENADLGFSWIRLRRLRSDSELAETTAVRVPRLIAQKRVAPRANYLKGYHDTATPEQ